MVKLQPSKLLMRVRFPLPAYCFRFEDYGVNDYGVNKIGNLITGRGERPFALTEEWRSYLILIPKKYWLASDQPGKPFLSELRYH